MDLSPRIQNDCQTDICRTEFQKQYLSPKANAFSIDSLLGQRDVKSQDIIEEHSTRDHELPTTPPHADSPPRKSFSFLFFNFLTYISIMIYSTKQK